MMDNPVKETDRNDELSHEGWVYRVVWRSVTVIVPIVFPCVNTTSMFDWPHQLFNWRWSKDEYIS